MVMNGQQRKGWKFMRGAREIENGKLFSEHMWDIECGSYNEEKKIIQIASEKINFRYFKKITDYNSGFIEDREYLSLNIFFFLR